MPKVRTNMPVNEVARIIMAMNRQEIETLVTLLTEEGAELPLYICRTGSRKPVRFFNHETHETHENYEHRTFPHFFVSLFFCIFLYLFVCFVYFVVKK